PEQPRPAPVVLSGPINVSIKEWNVPTLGSRPHDPEPGPDGSIWWTGMFANVLGRFNPKTGEFKEYPAKTPASGPHGLELDKEGNLWFTANSKGYIGKLDPKTGAVTEYKLPEDVRDPHTPLFSSSGMLFFTAQNSNYVGRLDPNTGKVTEWASPSGPKTQPYGITYLNGAIWYVESAIRPNVLVRFDIKTEKFQSWLIPGGGGVVRNIKATDDGRNIVMAES